MPRHVAIGIGLFVAIVVVAVGGRFAADKVKASRLLSASDAGKVERTYRLGMDNWIGYAPLCGDEMARRLALVGLGLECVNDDADYRARFAAVRSGDLDLAVTTVDAYLRDFDRNGPSGALVAVVDESAGGDAMLARRDVAGDLVALSARTGGPVSVAFTPASPSEYLMIAVGQHFGIPFEDSARFRRLETDGSGAALAALKSGKAGVAVLWEPDVSAALKDPEVVKLIGSEDTADLIVDVLAASPRMIADHGEDLQTILQVFFDTLNFYESESVRRNADLAAHMGVNESEVAAMVGGVRWTLLLDNGVTWFDEGPNGFGEKRLTKTLHGTQATLHKAGLVRAPRLESSEILTLVYSGAVEQMYASAFGAQDVPVPGALGFSELSDAEWAALKEIGALQVDDITFQPGTSLLTADSREALDELAQVLEHYPKYRLLIRGHTANVGDPAANRQLSVRRASAVLDYLLFNHPIDANRVRAEGYGGERPLERLPGESLRAWRYRLPRVELNFVGERR